MKRNVAKHKNPLNINFIKYNQNQNKNLSQNMLYSIYKEKNNAKISLLKDYNNNNLNINQNYLQNPLNNYIHKKHNIKNDLNYTIYKRLTTDELLNYEDISTNKLFFENSYNENNNRRNIHNNSLKIPKRKTYNNNLNNQETILINNGIIKNMFINDSIDNKYYSQMNYTENNIKDININDISNENLYKFKYNYYKTNPNNNFCNFAQNNFIKNNNNNKYIKDKIINNYIFTNNQKNSPKKIIIKRKNEKNIMNSNYKIKNNIKGIPYNNKKINPKYIIQNNKIIKNNDNSNYIPINPKIYKKTHYYSRTNIYNNKINDNNDIFLEDLSFTPLPEQIQQMKKNFLEPKKIDFQNNKLYKHQSYNKIVQKKNINLNKKYNDDENNNDRELISTSSDELSLLADEIINKFHKNKRVKDSSYSFKKYNIINNKSEIIGKRNNTTKNHKNPNINVNINVSDIKNYNSRKINSLIIPMNINKFILQSHDNIKKNENNITFKNIKLKKDINKNQKIYSGISKNETNKKYEIKKIEKIDKNNKISIIYNNKNLEKKEKNENVKINIDKKEDKRKNSESNDEDLNLIEQIMNNAENEEKNKLNRHINFNLEDNIYIHYNSKDLITKKNIYKGNKQIEIINNGNINDEKKMDIYYALLKSKTKFNPIIKKFNKNDIKINKEYELNEDLEEYEILGDLYNIFYSKNINELDDKLKKTIDKFMKDKK